MSEYGEKVYIYNVTVYNKEKEPIDFIKEQTSADIAKLKASFKNGESVRYRMIGVRGGARFEE
jgi:hypothetical protein